MYSDGHVHCHACGYHKTESRESSVSPVKRTKPMISGVFRPLPHRAISEETCRKYGYMVAKEEGRVVEIAPYYENGTVVGQKIRYGDVKQFEGRGNMKNAGLWGKQAWGNKGKRVVITEGEIDAMSVSEVYENKWPVVSVPSSTQAESACRKDIEWLLGFEQVVICMDSDEPGRKAAIAVAKVLPPGKAFIVTLPMKDPNEMLVAGRAADLKQCLWQGAAYRPDGILHVSSVVPYDRDTSRVWSMPWRGLTDFLIGQRPGEISMWTSGTGSGKSTFLREVMYDHLLHDRPIGMMMLEENPHDTLDDLISLRIGKPVRRIRALRALNSLRVSEGLPDSPLAVEFTDDEYMAAYEWFKTKTFYLYDHVGCNEYGDLSTKIEYMATGLGCCAVVLDHITIAASHETSREDKDDLAVIDSMMNSLRSIVERTGLHLDLISQLRKAKNTQYEEGGRIGVQDLKGSGSLGQHSNTILASERNRQSDDPVVRNTSLIRILKDRFTGRSGIATALWYNPESGRTVEIEHWVDEHGNYTFGGPVDSPTTEATVITPSEII